ncbi:MULTISPECIES: cation-translocating P-type ATPase [unclassified Flavobacterium]|jgi:Ca2+-transporting ATPase|uniref:cation-translocating P-type ATPase n=1 Tax=unclassified Flavobacterium TaxID=196869 RepID=UPI0025C23B6B|nr:MULTISPECIES: cation-translocating P-type ATPase [unclassified Flavobacterium]
MNQGLNTAEAKERLITHGYNELPSAKPKNIWRIAFEVMKEPMFVLLISCAVLYMIIGDYREGSILLASVLVIIFITFYQYQKTEKALEALRKLSSPRALVIRDGIEIRIPGREVVPDDLIILNEGDRIAADGIVLDTVNLTIDESLLTGESIAVTKNIHTDSSNAHGLVFSGTIVVQGKGLAKIIATGIHTQFGKIGASLESIEEDKTRLQKEMSILIRRLFIIGAFISIGIVAAFYYTRGNFIQSLLNGLSAAMAILPEEFPVVLTVFLALGAWRLSKNNVLTRKPSAIETLGSATVLCSDKTGTITQNKMDVAALYDGNEIFLKSVFDQKQNQITDLVTTAQHASQKDSIDPMEKAINITNNTLASQNESEYKLIKEYPLSRELLAMTRVTENSSENSFSVSAKGAPEVIFTLCKMNEQKTAKHILAVNQMAEQGFRVIAVANAVLQNKNLPESQYDFDFNFLGLIGLEDPIRTEVPQAIKECKEAGIKVIMITGDFPATAKSIAKQIGLSDKGEIITGDELKKMSDEELKEKIKRTNIFARVVPEQKLRIVQALKANNDIVAMTGDGVNDAPALKAAHIGIAMGNKGTDVAREASSLVLLDDNFASIVSAIRSGRRIFDNLQKAMSYIIAIHIPIIGLTLLPAFFTSLPLLLMPLHIVFMELIIDPVCSIAFEYEQEEKGIMNRQPRNPNEQFFGGKRILLSVSQGLILLIMVVVVYFICINEGDSDGEVRAIAFSSLIFGNIFLILTNLSNTRGVISVIKEKNYAVILILSAAIIILFTILSVPSLQRTFSFEVTDYNRFIPSVLGSISILIIFETIKYTKNRRNAKEEQ